MNRLSNRPISLKTEGLKPMPKPPKLPLTIEQKNELINEHFDFYLDNLKNEDLKKKTILALQNAPDYFWTISTYTATERCPDDEKECSMLRRTLKTVYYAKSLAQCWQLTDLKDEIVCAAILNDVKKLEYKWACHGPQTAEWLTELWRDKKLGLTAAEKDVIQIIKLHDGRAWSNLEILPIIWDGMRRVQMAAWLVCTAVYFSSRKKTSWDWE